MNSGLEKEEEAKLPVKPYYIRASSKNRVSYLFTSILTLGSL